MYISLLDALYHLLDEVKLSFRSISLVSIFVFFSLSLSLSLSLSVSLFLSLFLCLSLRSVSFTLSNTYA